MVLGLAAAPNAVSEEGFARSADQTAAPRRLGRVRVEFGLVRRPPNRSADVRLAQIDPPLQVPKALPGEATVALLAAAVAQIVVQTPEEQPRLGHRQVHRLCQPDEAGQ